jgi:GntR family transcriptional repressor for pyruvate dehydrogenase complex
LKHRQAGLPEREHLITNRTLVKPEKKGTVGSTFQKNTLVDVIIRELTRMIEQGEIKPGEFLPPRKDLAAHYGVGLSTIQEAIQALSAMGMLESRPGKGTWVSQDALNTLVPPSTVESRLGELDARKLYDARAIIEVGLTELAAKRATLEDVEQIWKAIARMEATLEDNSAFVEADLDFHLAVARAGHNELLEQFYYLARSLLADVITEIIKLSNVKEDAIEIQQQIAEAIAGHDHIKARQAAVDHMAIIDSLITEWSKQQAKPDPS